MNRLMVFFERGEFILYRLREGDGVLLSVFKSPEAQLVQDYCNANWPIGTQIDWQIAPQTVAPVRRNLNRHSWIIAPPVGSHI
jgi:hypothetical protein